MWDLSIAAVFGKSQIEQWRLVSLGCEDVPTTLFGKYGDVLQNSLC